MTGNAFAGCLLVGLGMVSAGVAWRFSLADGLIACGLGVLVLSCLALKVAGRR